MSVSEIAQVVINNGLASAGVAMLNIGDKIPYNKDEVVTNAIVNGALMTTGEYVVDYFQGNKVPVLEGNWWEVFDDVGFNSASYLGFSMLKLDAITYDTINKFEFIPEKAREVIVRGLLQTGSRTVAELIDKSPMLRHTVLKYLIHPSLLVRKT